MITFKLTNDINIVGEYSDIKFHFDNPNIQIIRPDVEENPRVFLLNVYDYDNEKIICNYEIKFTLNKKKIIPIIIKGFYDHDGNKLEIKQSSKYEHNCFNFSMYEMKNFVNKLKKNEQASFNLFIAETRYMLTINFDPIDNVLIISNMISEKTEKFDNCEVNIQLSLLNPLVKNNIMDQFESMYMQLEELEMLMVKKKIEF